MPMLHFWAAVAILGLWHGAQAQSQSCKDMIYENRNQTDYGPLQLTVIRGTVIDPQAVVIPQLCVGIFSEPDHKLISVSETNDKGEFEIKNVPKGDYRLVAHYVGFCPANVRVRIRPDLRGGKPLFIHMKPSGIDTCSYVDHKKK